MELNAGEPVLLDSEDLVHLDVWIALKNAIGLYFDATKTWRTRIKSINCKKTSDKTFKKRRRKKASVYLVAKLATKSLLNGEAKKPLSI